MQKLKQTLFFTSFLFFLSAQAWANPIELNDSQLTNLENTWGQFVYDHTEKLVLIFQKMKPESNFKTYATLKKQDWAPGYNNQKQTMAEDFKKYGFERYLTRFKKIRGIYSAMKDLNGLSISMYHHLKDKKKTPLTTIQEQVKRIDDAVQGR